MRINAFLAAAGFGARRTVERYIRNGEVEVDGKIIHDLATKVDPEQNVVKVAGRVVVLPTEHIYIALNKPPGVITSAHDPHNKNNVLTLLPPFKRRIFPVGRLDKNSEGLLFLTSDGDFANSILHPKFKLAKIYKVKVQGKVKWEALKA